MDSKKLTLLTVSSLEKIFPDEPFQPQAEYTGADMLLNERFSFQAAYCWEGPLTFKAGIQLSGTLADDVIIRQVGLAPSELPIFPDGDDFVLRTTPRPLSGSPFIPAYRISLCCRGNGGASGSPFLRNVPCLPVPTILQSPLPKKTAQSSTAVLLFWIA